MNWWKSSQRSETSPCHQCEHGWCSERYLGRSLSQQLGEVQWGEEQLWRCCLIDVKAVRTCCWCGWRERERAEVEAEVHGVCFFHSAPGQTLVKPGEEIRQDRKLQSLKCPEYFVCFCLFTLSHNFIFPMFVFLRLNIFLPFLCF